MAFYLLYCLGDLLCRLLPRRFCYGVARRLADAFSARSPKDWEAVRTNLQVILETPNVSPQQIREVFRNFAMYLVDFFQFSRLTPRKVRRWVRIEGLGHMQEALREGKGVIGVSAHLGNYEMAGAVFATLGMRVGAVVLTHQNPRVDRFFTRQRARVGVTGIAIQQIGRKAFFENVMGLLRANGVLGLIADRDFFQHGIELPFLGKIMKAPTGAAAFSLRTGAPIVPSFLVREPGGTYRFMIEAPIRCLAGIPNEEAVRSATQACLDVMARYIRRYPTQWYMFHQEFWKPGPVLVL